MATKVGVGESKEKDSFKAGAQAAQAALAQAGVEKCDFVIVFGTVAYNQEDLLKGVRSVTGAAPLSGCSAEGIITQNGPEEIEYVTGVMVFSSDDIKFFNTAKSGLKDSSKKVGNEIGNEIKKAMIKDPKLLLFFPDALTVNTRDLFDGVQEIVKEPIVFSGGGASDNWTMTKTYQYHNDQVLTDSASCVLLSGNFNIQIGVNHGCSPLGLEKEITKANLNKVYEIDNKPAWDVFKEYLPEDLKEFTPEVNQHLSICEKISDKEIKDYGQYIVRSPLLKLPDGSIQFGTIIDQGAKIKIGRRDQGIISQCAKDMTERIKSKIGDKKPIFAFHIECTARGKVFFGNKVKEKSIDIIQNTMGKQVPWFGFFAYGEFAPLNGKNYYHNETAVLCIVY